MNLMAAERLRELKGPKVLHRLEEIWHTFYCETLPMLEAILYMVKHKGRPCIRTTTLATFRDVVFLFTNVEDAIIRGKRNLPPGIRHAILILQCVNDSYPPSKNKLKIEFLAAQICSSYIGYYGLYQNGHLIVTSNEPMIISKRRPSADVGGPRRISRPFSIQPQQMDTLNQIFKNAVRHKTPKGRRPLR
ncbi:Proline-rich protein 5, partial [Stegodyphus mimosarum]